MNKTMIWTGVVICGAGVLMYIFIQLSSPALWLVLAAIGLLMAVFGAYFKPNSKNTKVKK